MSLSNNITCLKHGGGRKRALLKDEPFESSFASVSKSLQCLVEVEKENAGAMKEMKNALVHEVEVRKQFDALSISCSLLYTHSLVLVMMRSSRQHLSLVKICRHWGFSLEPQMKRGVHLCVTCWQALRTKFLLHLALDRLI